MASKPTDSRTKRGVGDEREYMQQPGGDFFTSRLSGHGEGTELT